LETPERKDYPVHTAIIDKSEQEVVNIYYINENNLYGCPHAQLDVGREKLIVVWDTGAEISLMPERIFEELLANGLRAPQLPVVNGALITAFGGRTGRTKWQALIEFEIDGFTRCPYGFRNSLPAFVTALQLTLGSDTRGYALAYVDDIIVYSPTFELHLKHLDTVLGRLTQAGFTVNAKKCKLIINLSN
jgi:hypothetical protein